MSFPEDMIWPDTCHPDLKWHFDRIRGLIEAQRSNETLNLLLKDPLTNEVQPLRLEIHTRFTQAPWAEIPYIYSWWVAMDKEGRWVSGSAHRDYIHPYVRRFIR